MNARVSSAVSLIIHLVLLTMVSMITLRSQKIVPPPAGMEIDISDFEHAMPLPQPSIARSEDAQGAVVPETREADPAVIDTAERQTPPAPEPSPPPPSVDALQTMPALPTPQLENLLLPQPELAPAPVEPEQPLLASAAPEITPKAEEVVAAVPAPEVPAAPPARQRLDSTALSRSLAAKIGDAPRSRLNATAIGSVIGKAVPKGAGALTIRQRTDLAQMIRSQITPCWNPPVADESSGHVTILMRIKLGRAGNIQGTPAVSRVSGQTTGNHAYVNALSNSVRRAVLRCAPLNLPDELYEAWADVELNFDPRDVS